MGQIEQHILCELFGEQESAFPASRRAKGETFAAEGTKIVAPALAVRASDSRYSLKIIPPHTKPSPDLLMQPKSIHGLYFGQSLLVSVAGLVEVMREDRPEPIRFPASESWPRCTLLILRRILALISFTTILTRNLVSGKRRAIRYEDECPGGPDET